MVRTWIFLIALLSSIVRAAGLDAEVDLTLGRAGENAPALRRALESVPAPQAEAMRFLIAHLPPRDARELSAEYLLENVALAFEARARVPWGASIPEELFLNDVLPHANVSEARDPWRRDFFDRFITIAQSHGTAGEAALALNREVFNALGVHYSTERRRADQSPKESIEQGKASCTGLSILLVNACRAVGIPARLAGIPNWTDKRGNHTWVEVWDGTWRFVGADEPDSRGFDHAWFTADAARAREHEPEHSIYAVSYAPTGVRFPMVWAENADPVHAVNVTARYAAPVAAAQRRLLVRVEGFDGRRVEARVSLTLEGTVVPSQWGVSRGESADLNDVLALEPNAVPCVIRAESDGMSARAVVEPKLEGDTHVTITLPAGPVEATRLRQAMAQALDRVCRGAPASADGEIEELLRVDPERVRTLAWQAYAARPEHDALREDFLAGRVRAEGYESPWVARTVGAMAPKGWALVIAMHGGGNAPQEVNDQQWGVMQKYYRDHPEAGGYVYCALRAPTNEWNGFYTDYMYPLVDALIRQFVLWGDVDPDRVIAIGYSHGGYGAFAIGPKMPDRFAAVHSSAAAPTDGQTSARTLRTLHFSYMIGEKDTAYGRRERCEAFDDQIKALRGERHDIYRAKMLFQAGHGHGGLPDRDLMKDLVPIVREAAPREISWEMTDGVIRDFYWISTDAPTRGRIIEGRVTERGIEIEMPSGSTIEIFADERLVDPRSTAAIHLNGQRVASLGAPSVETLLRSLWRRGDLRRTGTMSASVTAP